MAGKKREKKDPITSVRISSLQANMLRDASSAVESAMAQQGVALSAILAGHDLTMRDVSEQHLRISDDGTHIEWGEPPKTS